MTYTLVLDKYERDNLLLLLNLVGCPNTEALTPFNLMNTGDWVCQITRKLVPDAQTAQDLIVDVEKDNPNISRAEILKRLEFYH
jgi:hypothetical protein